MIVKLLANQIPTFWESIKFAVTEADEVDVKDLGAYLNNLLHSLLSDKSQCFVRLDDDRMLIGVMITRIEVDNHAGMRSLCLQCLYSFKNVLDGDWQTDFELFKNFARRTNCKQITFNTRNSRIVRLGSLVGFIERFSSYSLSIGGI